MKTAKYLLLLAIVLGSASLGFAEGKPKLTLDEFFNSVSYTSVALSPDGNSIVIGTERADWDQQIFRTDLWLYRDDGKGGSLIQLTQSGHDSDPKWSPDGRWIAFLSERKTSSARNSDSDSDDDKDVDKGDISQIYVISPAGGEAIPLTQGQEEVHTFSWSADSRTLYFATRNPWTKTQKDDYRKQWKDVVQYRTAERGDTIFALDVAAALARHATAPAKEGNDDEKESDLTPGARSIATLPLRVEELVTSPDGSKLAFISNSINQRQEKFEDYEIYTLDLANPAPRRLTNNQAQETKPHWANDNRHVFFSVEVGDVAGPYRDLQPHLYWVDSESGAVEQWSKDFIGQVDQYSVTADGVLASARLGTEVPMYSVAQPGQSLHKLNGWDGTY
jgi:Tol biopolymer transport system component